MRCGRIVECELPETVVDRASPRGLGFRFGFGASAFFLWAGVVMPILPIVDLMILTAWTSLLGAFVLKAIRVTTSYNPDLFGMGPMELTLVAGVLLLFALALTARTWLKAREFAQSSPRDRAAETLEAYSALKSVSSPLPGQGRSGAADSGREGPNEPSEGSGAV